MCEILGETSGCTNVQSTIVAFETGYGLTEEREKGRQSNIIQHFQAGEVVELGTHDELLAKKGLYYDLVNAQTFTDAVDNISGRLCTCLDP